MTDFSRLPLLLRRADALRARDADIRAATAAYPGMEIGAAYKKWKEARGEPASMVLATDLQGLRGEINTLIDQLRRRPCDRPGCTGTQFLEPVCSGCIEGQAGYKTKWTCRLCLHRELSKETLQQWLTTLSTASKP